MISGLEKVLLAILVLVLMVGMGSTITTSHARDVLEKPRGVLIGLASQFGWMPLIAFGLVQVLDLPDAFALGLVIVGCTPGGTTSNLFAYLVRGDVALSVVMTATSTLCAIVLMPLVLAVYATPFTSTSLEIPYGKIVSTLAVVLVPVAIGMAIRARNQRAALIAERIGSYSGIAVLVLLIVSSLSRNGALLWDTTPAMYGAAIGLGLCGFGLGYLSAMMLGLTRNRARTVALETGIQNSPLALAIIIASFPASRHMEILWLPLLYALAVLLSASLGALLFRYTRRTAT